MHLARQRLRTALAIFLDRPFWPRAAEKTLGYFGPSPGPDAESALSWSDWGLNALSLRIPKENHEWQKRCESAGTATFPRALSRGGTNLTRYTPYLIDPDWSRRHRDFAETSAQRLLPAEPLRCHATLSLAIHGPGPVVCCPF